MTRLEFVPLDDLGDNAAAIVDRLLEAAAEDTNVPKDKEEDDER